MGLVELMNEPPIKENGYSKIIEEETKKVYKKHFSLENPGSISLKKSNQKENKEIDTEMG